MKKVLSMILVILLMVSSLNLAYGFEEYVNMRNEVEAMANIVIPEYDNKMTSLFEQFNALNVNYDFISGTIVSENPFIVSLDFYKGITGGFSMFSGFPIVTKYAQISYPDWSCVKNGYYEAPHPYSNTYYSTVYYEDIRVYGATNQDIKKAYELEKSIKATAAESVRAQQDQKGFVSKFIEGKGVYTGQVDELGAPNGKGGFQSTLDHHWMSEGNFSHGMKHGYCTDGMWYQDTLVQELYIEKPSNVFLKLYVGTPGVRFSVFYEGELAYNSNNNFKKGMTLEINNIVYFPMREVVEHFDNYVSWNAVKGTTINDVISIKPNSDIINVRGNQVSLSGTVKVINGVTYVPIDFMTKAFDNNSYSYTIDSTSYIIPTVTIVQNIAG